MCVLRYDRSVSLGALFTEYMPQGRLASKGTPKQSTPTAYTRPMPAYTWNQVAVACLDGNNELIPSSLRVHDGEWVGTSFITGAGFPSTRQQSNTFGYANGYETLFWSSASDWRELNIIDTGNTLPTNTANHGWSVWKTPGATDGECANARIDSSNQLVLMVREPREGTAVGARRCSGVFFFFVCLTPTLLCRHSPAAGQCVHQQLELHQERLPGRLPALRGHHGVGVGAGANVGGCAARDHAHVRQRVLAGSLGWFHGPERRRQLRVLGP